MTIFGNSGGGMEEELRLAYEKLSNKKLKDLFSDFLKNFHAHGCYKSVRSFTIESDLGPLGIDVAKK